MADCSRPTKVNHFCNGMLITPVNLFGVARFIDADGLSSLVGSAARAVKTGAEAAQYFCDVAHQVVGRLFVLDYGQSVASRHQHGRHHAHAKPGPTVPALDEDGPHPGIDEKSVRLGMAVVQATGYF